MSKVKQEKTKMSDEERLKLAEKLDKELDEFIENLPRKKYEDGWPEDRWEEEMNKHPFFMKTTPEPGSELHPLYEGLQKLKYDPEENEPEELAQAYKDDGNFHFKYKKYRMAIISYTEGLKAKSGSTDLDAILLNNRAAAHYHLKNYRSALNDCMAALKLKPNYTKASIMAANCCFDAGKYDEAVEYCDKILNGNEMNKTIENLKEKCIKLSKIKSRDQRKQHQIEKRKDKEEEQLVALIRAKGISIDGAGGNLNLSNLEPQVPQLCQNRVHLDENLNLVWPVIFIYPEYRIMDYIQEFNEKTTLIEQLFMVFEETPEWDKEKKYKIDNLNVYHENLGKIIKIDTKKTLEEILKIDGFIVKAGTPSFIILLKNSETENHFLKS